MTDPRFVLEGRAEVELDLAARATPLPGLPGLTERADPPLPPVQLSPVDRRRLGSGAWPSRGCPDRSSQAVLGAEPPLYLIHWKLRDNSLSINNLGSVYATREASRHNEKVKRSFEYKKRPFPSGSKAAFEEKKTWEYFQTRAENMDRCHQNFFFKIKENNPERFQLQSNSCKDKFCSMCSHERAMKAAPRIELGMNQAKEQGRIPKFLTLTQVSRAGEKQRAARSRFKASFAGLRRGKEWRRHVYGAAGQVETTWNGKSGSWHFHLHLIIDADYWPHADLLAEWQKVSPGALIVDIRRATVGSPWELLKYTAKLSHRDKKTGEVVWMPPEKIRELALASRNTKDLNFYGAWRALKVEEPVEPEVDEDGAWIEKTIPELNEEAASGEEWAIRAVRAINRWMNVRLERQQEKKRKRSRRIPDRGS